MAKVQVVAILGSLLLLAAVIELVRRRTLREDYSLLWLLTGVVLVVLSFWRDLLELLARAVGIFYPPTALFVVAFGFVLLILLQFSLVISRLSAESIELAQQMAVLKWRLRQLEGSSDGPRREGPSARADEG